MRHPVFATNIRCARDRLGISQEEVAAAAGLRPRVYQRHEQHGENPELLTLLKIAAGLQTTAAALLHGVTLDDVEPSPPKRTPKTKS